MKTVKNDTKRPKRKNYKSFLSGLCQVCGQEGDTEAHHIVPLSADGPDTLNNLVELCLNCHSLAHNHRSSWRRKALEGIAKAKAEGKYQGRKPSINREEVKTLHDKGHGATEIAKSLGIHRSSVYRVLDEKEYENEDSSNGHRDRQLGC